MGRQSVRVGILVSVAACGFAACGPAPAPHPISADPHSLVISLADLPGWTVDAPDFGLISDPRKMLGDSSDVTPYTNNGWVRTYEADFRSDSTTGAQSISVLVHVFRDPGGAQSFFMQGIGGQDHGGQTISPAPALGARSKIFRQNADRSPGVAGTTWYWFYWLDRNVLARVLVKGPLDAESAAVRIARREAEIIQQH
jgi:hypothetical protein